MGLSIEVENLKQKGLNDYDLKEAGRNAALAGPDYTWHEARSSAFTSQGGVNFFHYLKRFKLAGERNLVVLPPDHHYFYDESEFRNVRILISTRRLNQVKDIDSFMESLMQILHPEINFIGCFSDYRTSEKRLLISRLLKRIYNFLDSKKEHQIDKKAFLNLLERHGFRAVNMTEISGLTYFNLKSNQKSAVSKA